MQRRKLIKGLLAATPALWLNKYVSAMPFAGAQGFQNEPMATGPFKPDWKSLKQYKTPDWFRDAKFGMWRTGVRNANRNMATGMHVLCMMKGAMPINFIAKNTDILQRLALKM